jgi:hypothetical protein
MADEETGFTFVDKRRTASEQEASAPEQEAAASEPVQEEGVSSSVQNEDLDEPEDAAPSVYDLVGYCISLLSAEAWQKLGLLADPRTGDSRMDLTQAKVAIDGVTGLAALLENSPNDLVPETLRRDLRTLLNDLRLNYVSRRGESPLSRN